MKKSALWTKEDIDCLTKNKNLSTSQLSRILSRSIAAVNQKRTSLGIVPEPKWTKEKVIEKVRERRAHGEDLRAGYMHTNHKALYRAGYRLFGTWEKVIRAAGIDYKEIKTFENWNEQKIIDAIIERHNRGLSLNALSVHKENAALLTAAWKHLGSWKNAIEKAGLDYSTIRKIKQVEKFSKEAVIEQIKKWRTEGELLNHQNINRKYPNFEAQARRKFGSWQKAVESAGFNYDSIMLCTHNEIKRGFQFERLMKNYFALTKKEYIYHRRVNISNRRFYVPDFMDRDKNIWIDCKLRCWSFGVNDAIEKYVPYAFEVHFYYLFGNAPREMNNIKFFDALKIPNLSCFPEIKEKLEKLKEETLIEEEEVLRKPQTEQEIIEYLSKNNLRERILRYYNNLGRFPRRKDMHEEDRLWKHIVRMGGAKKVSSILGLKLVKVPRKPMTDQEIVENLSKNNLRERILAYYTELGRFPRRKDMKRGDDLWRCIENGGGSKNISFLLNLYKKGCRITWTWERLKTVLDEICRQTGRFPTKNELKNRNMPYLYSHINHFGGTQKVAERLGYELRKSQKAHRYSFEELKKELIPLYDDIGRMPTYKELNTRKKGDLAHAIIKYGGIYKISELLGFTPFIDRNEERNWNFVKIELEKMKKTLGKFPSMNYIKENGTPRLNTLITTHFDGLHEVAKRMGEEMPMKSPGYWTIERVESELRVIFDSTGRLPSRKDLKMLRKEYLIDPIKKHGGIHVFAKRMGLVYGRKPVGYFKNLENLKKELLPLCIKLSRFPTRKELENSPMKNLAPIISREGGFRKIAKMMGYSTKKS